MTGQISIRDMAPRGLSLPNAFLAAVESLLMSIRRDNDGRRDPYGRGVPDSFEPYDDEPYPQGFPPEGRFSTRYGRDPERTKRLSWR